VTLKISARRQSDKPVEKSAISWPMRKSNPPQQKKQ
jgi:hypothetical protein